MTIYKTIRQDIETKYADLQGLLARFGSNNDRSPEARKRRLTNERKPLISLLDKLEEAHRGEIEDCKEQVLQQVETELNLGLGRGDVADRRGLDRVMENLRYTVQGKKLDSQPEAEKGENNED